MANQRNNATNLAKFQLTDDATTNEPNKTHRTDSRPAFRLDGEIIQRLHTPNTMNLERFRKRGNLLSVISDLNAIGRELTNHTSEKAVFEKLLLNLCQLLNVASLKVSYFDRDRLEPTLAFEWHADSRLEPQFAPTDERHACAIKCQQLGEVVSIVENSSRHGAEQKFNYSRLFAPLQKGTRVFGVVEILCRGAHAYGDPENLILTTLCQYCALALDNIDTHVKLAFALKNLKSAQNKANELEQTCRRFQQSSYIDPLTGLHNRRFLLEHIDADVSLSLRRHEQFGSASPQEHVIEADLLFFLVDIDHFKQVNDDYGHAAGDAMLQQVRERLFQVTRGYDYLIRWGGEEFLIVSRETDRRNAEQIAERIRAAIADRPFELPGGVRLKKTCSIGFACYPYLPKRPRLLSWQKVIELADRELYAAKQNGRNAWAGLHRVRLQQCNSATHYLLRRIGGAERIVEMMLDDNMEPDH